MAVNNLQWSAALVASETCQDEAGSLQRNVQVTPAVVQPANIADTTSPIKRIAGVQVKVPAGQQVTIDLKAVADSCGGTVAFTRIKRLIVENHSEVGPLTFQGAWPENPLNDPNMRVGPKDFVAVGDMGTTTVPGGWRVEAGNNLVVFNNGTAEATVSVGIAGE